LTKDLINHSEMNRTKFLKSIRSPCSLCVDVGWFCIQSILVENFKNLNSIICRNRSYNLKYRLYNKPSFSKKYDKRLFWRQQNWWKNKGFGGIQMILNLGFPSKSLELLDIMQEKLKPKKIFHIDPRLGIEVRYLTSKSGSQFCLFI